MLDLSPPLTSSSALKFYSCNVSDWANSRGIPVNGGEPLRVGKDLGGHSKIKMTERYAKLAKQHIARTSNTAREMWKLLEPISKKEAVG